MGAANTYQNIQIITQYYLPFQEVLFYSLCVLLKRAFKSDYHLIYIKLGMFFDLQEEIY